MRGYVSILSPNVGAAVPPTSRTRLVGANSGSLRPSIISGYSNSEMNTVRRPATKNLYHGLDANSHLSKPASKSRGGTPRRAGAQK